MQGDGVKITMHKAGWHDITIRNTWGYWEMLRYIDIYGGQHWDKIKMSDQDIEANIKLMAPQEYEKLLAEKAQHV